MSKRVKCPACHYPESTCICDSITVVDTKLTISILQDPTESKHAKNTARLAALAIPGLTIHVGNSPEDFTAVKRQVAQFDKNLLIYPSDNAENIEHIAAKPFNYEHLILLDGTWRKAKKIWLINPWLHDLDTGIINPSSLSHYSIRKRPNAQSLSTLEALAYSLNALDDVPLPPFFDLLNAMQQHWQNHQPNHSCSN